MPRRPDSARLATARSPEKPKKRMTKREAAALEKRIQAAFPNARISTLYDEMAGRRYLDVQASGKRVLVWSESQPSFSDLKKTFPPLTRAQKKIYGPSDRRGS